MRRGHVFDASCMVFWAVLFQACIAPALGQATLQAETEPGTLHWALAVILGLVLIAGLIRSYRILKQTQHLTVVRHAPEGMRIVECGNCRTPQYVSARGRIFICCGCHCANRIPLEVGRTEELIVPEGPLKKFEFKKGGENYWQEVSQEEVEDDADLALTPSRPQRALEEDVDKVAPSVIGKVDVESASNDGGLPQCVVCLDETGNMVLLPCAHGGVCEECVTRIVQNRAFGGAHCPHCRSGIRTIVKLQEVEGELAKGVELRIPMARPVS